MTTKRLGLIMNGVTGRMGLNQHLIRSIIAIRDQGGVLLANGDRMLPDPILIGRDADKVERLAKRFNVTVGQLERINQRSRTDKLVPKETIVVYAPIGRNVPHQVTVAGSGGPLPLAPVEAPSPDDLPAVPEPASNV